MFLSRKNKSIARDAAIDAYVSTPPGMNGQKACIAHASALIRSKMAKYDSIIATILVSIMIRVATKLILDWIEDKMLATEVVLTRSTTKF